MTLLAPTLEAFFTQHMAGQRQASPRTIGVCKHGCTLAATAGGCQGAGSRGSGHALHTAYTSRPPVPAAASRAVGPTIPAWPSSGWPPY